MSEPQTTITINTPDGEIVANETKVESFPQSFIVVTGDELRELQELSQQAPEFVAAYLPQIQKPGLKDYDQAFHAWQLSESQQHSNQEVVVILGGYLGNKCVEDFDMEWVTVTDQYGTDYAVRSKTVELLAFPFSTVQKRVEDHEHDFLNGVYYTIQQTIGSGAYKKRDPAPSDQQGQADQK